jgi:hypothetical protein
MVKRERELFPTVKWTSHGRPTGGSYTAQGGEGGHYDREHRWRFMEGCSCFASSSPGEARR